MGRRIATARQITIIGGHLASALVGYFEYYLLVLGMPVQAATTAGRLVHLLSGLTKRDLVIAISFRRGLRQTVEGLSEARAQGAHCVAIANSSASPLVRYADEAFIVPVEGSSFVLSYIAPIALINMLLVACSRCNWKRTMSRLKEVAREQRTGFRWYSEP